MDMPSRYLYWSQRGSISRIKTDGTGLEAFVDKGIGRRGIVGLTVDWIASEFL